MTPKNTICLWFDKDAEEAARFYAATFPDSRVTAVREAPADYPGGKKGEVLTVEFTVLGIPCLGLNGGPVFRHSEAFSFQIATEDQAETDRYWNAITGNGGAESQCGWCRDRWGLSWQITPRALTDAMAAGGAEAKRAFAAMMTMKKIDVAAIEAARRGMSPMMIVLAEAADLPHLAAVKRSAARKFHAHRGTMQAGDEPILAHDILIAAHRGKSLWVAKENGRHTGFLAATSQADCLHIEELSVVFGDQGRGIGGALLDAALAAAAARGCLAATLTTSRDLPWSFPFYARRGFVEVAPGQGPDFLAAIIRRDQAKSFDPAQRVAMMRAVAAA